MTEDVVEYEFDKLEDGTPVGRSTIVDNNSVFFATGKYNEAGQSKPRKRLTEDYEDVEVAIPNERYIVDAGKYDHVLNEDFEEIERRSFSDIQLITDNPDIDDNWDRRRDVLLANALQKEYGEDFSLTAVYVGHGIGGFDDSILVDDGEEVVEAVYLGDLGLKEVEWDDNPGRF